MAEFKGYVYLQRSLMDSSIWNTDEKFCRRAAWIDLILLVNHEDKRVMSATGDEMTVRRGQYLTSISKLAERWHWSPATVRRWFVKLQSAKMIIFEGVRFGKGATIVTVLNYSKYQDLSQFADKHSEEQVKSNGKVSGEQVIDKQRIKRMNKELKENKRIHQ